jgi:hypothetical protein
MAASFKLGTQLFEIVNLAVQNDPDCFLGIRHWLMPSGQIDDGKPPKPKSDRTRDEVTLIVGTAVKHGLGHPPDRARLHRLVPGKVKLAANAAHCSAS